MERLAKPSSRKRRAGSIPAPSAEDALLSMAVALRGFRFAFHEFKRSAHHVRLAARNIDLETGARERLTAKAVELDGAMQRVWALEREIQAVQLEAHHPPTGTDHEKFMQTLARKGV